MSPTGVMPLMRYRDVAAAIAWLSTVFGFERRSVVTDSDGSIAYAELWYGSGVVMIGPVGGSPLDNFFRQPSELGGVSTQSAYVAVEDIEAHLTRARAGGAEIVVEFGEASSASQRAYAARDLEGHIWNIGSYSPWTGTSAHTSGEDDDDIGIPYAPATRLSSILQTGLSAAVLALAGLTIAAVWLAPAEPVAIAQSRNGAANPADAANRDNLSEARRATASASDDTGSETAAVRKALNQEVAARRDAVRTIAAMREELGRERAARETAEASSVAARSQLLRERDARVRIDELEKSAAGTPGAANALDRIVRPEPVAKRAAEPSRSQQTGTAVAPETTSSITPAPADAASAAQPDPVTKVAAPDPAPTADSKPDPSQSATTVSPLPASRPVTTGSIDEPAKSSATPDADPVTAAPQPSATAATPKSAANPSAIPESAVAKAKPQKPKATKSVQRLPSKPRPKPSGGSTLGYWPYD